MINLKEIIVVAAWLSVPVSVWFIVYFIGRLVLNFRIRKDLGDMPSVEEISEHYEINNAVIRYSPIAKRSDLK